MILSISCLVESQKGVLYLYYHSMPLCNGMIHSITHIYLFYYILLVRIVLALLNIPFVSVNKFPVSD